MEKIITATATQLFWEQDSNSTSTAIDGIRYSIRCFDDVEYSVTMSRVGGAATVSKDMIALAKQVDAYSLEAAQDKVAFLVALHKGLACVTFRHTIVTEPKACPKSYSAVGYSVVLNSSED